jgi:energy-coupling factor transport system ATP-binding protein
MVNELNPTTVDWAPQLPCLIQDAPINNNTLLTIQNLSFGYSKQLFDKINLTLKAGEIITIHGKNGAGKSTLLKLISKILPVSNAIYLNNRDIAGIKDYWNEIFLLWQNPESHFIFNTVLEEVSGNEQLLSEFKLNTHAKHSPFNLSEGQKRRLSLAIALTKRPKLFLLDEPSFGQDYQNKLILAHKIVQLAKNGHAFIIITHDLMFSSAIAHKTYNLINGRLELIHEPTTMVRK